MIPPPHFSSSRLAIFMVIAIAGCASSGPGYDRVAAIDVALRTSARGSADRDSCRVRLGESDAARVIGALNDGRREPMKFIPRYHVYLVFDDGSARTIGVSGDLFKDSSGTYRAGVDLARLLEPLVVEACRQTPEGTVRRP